MTMHSFLSETRNAAGTQIGRYWSNRLWGSCPWNAISDNPGLGFTKIWKPYDWGTWFITRATSGTAQPIDEYWSPLRVSAGAATDSQGVTAANPVAPTNLAGTLTSVNAGAAVTPAAGRKIWLEGLVKHTPQTASGYGATWFGLATILEGLSSAGAPAGTNRIGFLSENSATNDVLFNYKDAGDSEYEADTTFNWTTGEIARVGFYIDGLRSVTPFINGLETSLGTIVAGQAPGGGNTFDLPDALMTVCVANVANGGTGTPLSDYYWIRLAVFDEDLSVVTLH